MSPSAMRVAAAPPTAAASRCDLHLAELAEAIDRLRPTVATLSRWAEELEAVWSTGGRLLVAGNGGSAALAEHLTAELVGRYQGEHEPRSAIALTGDTAAVTAIANDYGYERVFARQVQAHGRPGDVLLTMSTSGRSPNLLAAAAAARERSMRTWCLVAEPTSPLALACDEAVTTPASSPVVQELQQVVVHLLCELIDGAA